MFLSGLMLNASAQSFDARPEEGFTSGASTEFELVVHGWIVNFDGDSNFTWTRIQNNLQAGWTSAICDAITCWATSVNTNTFVIKPGDSSILDLHFYLANTAGCGEVLIRVWKGTDEANADTIKFNACTWAASVASLGGDKSIKIFPNPTQGLLNLEFATTGTAEVEIYDVLGKKLKTFSHTGLNSTLDLSDLPDGLYVIRVNENGVQYSRTFRKAN